MKAHRAPNISLVISSVIACILLLFCTSSRAAVIVTAGSLEGIAGSLVGNPGPTLNAVYGGDQSDGTIHMVLDLGSAQFIDKITLVNRIGTTTDLSIRTLSIWVAPLESAGGFDPWSLSSYTTNVFSDQFLTPSTNAMGASRVADISDSNRRYFLLNVSSSFFTGAFNFSHTPNNNSIQYSDVKVTAVPEPATTILLGAAFTLFLIQRRCRFGKAR